MLMRFQLYTDGMKPDPKDLEKVHEGLKWLNSYLEGHFFAVGNRITVADFPLVATIGMMNSTGIDLSKYPNISSWFGRCRQQMRGYDKLTKQIDETIRTSVKGKFRN
ncbi:Glutathione S-transferase 1, isoform D [Armadillidium vulgare]|nr:Glutathione S-transferase 1, isoform D [Armadillidium vulgare]